MAKSPGSLLLDDCKPTSRNGARDQRRILELVLEKGIPAYGLICIAKDPTASPRTIKSIRPDYLRRLKVEKNSKGIWVRYRKKELLLDVVERLRTQTSGIADLANPPKGNTAPDRALSVGYKVTRDSEVREYVIQRAEGCCEYCDEPGFLMANGEPYLEAHHIIALSKEGCDTVDNVIALCPQHHREAHFGARAASLEAEFIEKVRLKQKS